MSSFNTFKPSKPSPAPVAGPGSAGAVAAAEASATKSPTLQTRPQLMRPEGAGAGMGMRGDVSREQAPAVQQPYRPVKRDMQQINIPDFLKNKR